MTHHTARAVATACLALALASAGRKTADAQTARQSTRSDSARADSVKHRGPQQLAPVNIRGERLESNGYVPLDNSSATKMDLPIMATPQTVTVVTHAQIEAQQAQTVPQALHYVPGIVTETWGADARFDSKYGSMIVRGFSPEEYLDGMKVLAGTFTTPQVDPYSLENIAFVQGPASVLYGQTAPGGVFNSESKRPTATPLHEVEVQTGSYHRAQLAADFGGPIDDSAHFRYRLTALGRDADTQVEFQKSQRLLVDPAFTWQPSDRTSLTVLGSYQRDPDAGFYYYYPIQRMLLAPPGDRLSSSFYGGDASNDSYGLDQVAGSWLFHHQFGAAWSFDQHARVSNVRNAISMVYPVGFTQDANGQPDLGTFDRYLFLNHERLSAFTIDNQAHTVFATGALRHQVLAGVDYQHQLMTTSSASPEGPPLDIANPDYHQVITGGPIDWSTKNPGQQFGVYAQDVIETGPWVVLGGLREDDATSSVIDRLAGTTTAESDHAASGHAGLLYRAPVGVSPYVSYSTSFQPTGGSDYFGTPFKPTTGQQVEGGIKYQPTAVNALFSVAVYNLTQQNVTTADLTHTCTVTPTPDHCGSYSVQTGEIRSRGVELSAVASLMQGLDVTTSYAYLDNVVSKANDESQGMHPIGIPANTASLWADYSVAHGPARGVGFAAGLRYSDRTYVDDVNTMTVPARTLVDAGLHYDLRNAIAAASDWRIAVNATNLFDKTYFSACDVGGCYFGSRRTVLATVTHQW